MHDLAFTDVPIPILWKTSDIEEKRARSIRRLYMGIGVSILCHALLFVFMPRRQEMGEQPSASAKGPLVVRLAPKAVETPAASAESVPEPPVAPRHRPPPAPNIMSVPKQVPQSPAVPLPQPTPTDAAEPPSMMAMVEAARARRQANEDALRRLNAEQRAGDSSSGDDPATASLKRNLQTLSRRGETSGVFQILQKGHRSGQFAFRGWTTGAASDWKQVIDVDAGPQGDLELAMVRKMIELIRQHYKGNFNWESHRKQRVIVLSARMEDSAGLEDFLMEEFFGSGR